jgi:methanogenic corrinoid protein MtbC1
MHSFTIKDLENLSGIRAHTLRVWEQRFDFLKPERTFSNIRHYNNEELKSVLNVALLNKYGYKISLIAKMSATEIKERVLTLNPIAQQETVINDLVKAMVDFAIEDFESILEKYVAAKGLEKTITQIVFPYLEKIGILWMTNHINPAQEHMVSNVIRQKIITAIDTCHVSFKLNKTFLLFLPENEFHELGLLFMHYLLKSRGVTVIYLGANIPIKDIELVAALKKPDYIYSHLTTVGQNFRFDKFLATASKVFGKTPVIISGQLTNTYQKKIHPPLYFKRSYKEVMDFISVL